MIQLILGGARSGKSRLAEQTAILSTLPVTYIATAQAWDDEMQERITHHQAQRPATWNLVEEPLYLADCLTLWMSNVLMHDNAQLQQDECKKLLDILPHLQSDILLVSNETGLGIVPMGQLSRKFVDESGRLHQQLGQISDKVIFCVAGFPMILKGDKV